MEHAELKTVVCKDTTANPAPLGLLGFAMTTILLNIHNAGFFPLDSMILSMGIFYGGLCQLFVGIMEWKKGNTFGTTAFTSYGAFWLSLVALLVLPKMNLAAAPTSEAMGCYLLMWGLFSLALTVGTFRISRALQVVFVSLTVLFVLLAVADFTENPAVKTFAGFEGIFCGFSAFYAAIAQVLNEVFGRKILPLGEMSKAH